MSPVTVYTHWKEAVAPKASVGALEGEGPVASVVVAVPCRPKVDGVTSVMGPLALFLTVMLTVANCPLMICVGSISSTAVKSPMSTVFDSPDAEEATALDA